jgi:hypothetical protein
MANRGELRLAYNNRRSNWISKDPEEIPTVRSFKEVDCRMFVHCTTDCVSEQSTDKKVISYYRKNVLVGQVVWVEDGTLFRLIT